MSYLKTILGFRPSDYQLGRLVDGRLWISVCSKEYIEPWLSQDFLWMELFSDVIRNSLDSVSTL